MLCLLLYGSASDQQSEGWQVTAGRHSFFRAVGSWSLRLSALMDSDLAWVNGKSGIRYTKLMICWRFQALCNIGSHLPFILYCKLIVFSFVMYCINIIHLLQFFYCKIIYTLYHAFSCTGCPLLSVYCWSCYHSYLPAWVANKHILLFWVTSDPQSWGSS